MHASRGAAAGPCGLCGTPDALAPGVPHLPRGRPARRRNLSPPAGVSSKTARTTNVGRTTMRRAGTWPRLPLCLALLVGLAREAPVRAADGGPPRGRLGEKIA